MHHIKSVAVFCGSRPGSRPAFIESANILGQGLAKSGIKLVYGGGRVGMMGAVADSVLAAGGDVIGVIPYFLAEREVAHAGVKDMTITDNMHVRKKLMFDQSDAFVIMPGGLGTLDEFAEIVTWRQLGLHDKPILIIDVDGWAKSLVQLLEAFIADGFVAEESRALYEVIPDVPSLLVRLQQGKTPDDPGKSALL